MQGRLSALDGSGSQPSPLYQPVIFGGEYGAQTVEKGGAKPLGPGTKQLPHARAMEAAGEEPQNIFHTTGWYHAPDGQWKWVLSDQNAALNPKAFGSITEGGKYDDRGRLVSGKPVVTGMTLNVGSTTDDKGNVVPYKLPEVLNHPDLFKAYPFLKDAIVQRIPPGSDPSLQASYDPFKNIVQLGLNKPPDRMLSSLLHELQHGVQFVEGFGSGGSVSEMLPANYNEIRKPIEDTFLAARKRLEDAGGDADAVINWHASRDLGQPISAAMQNAYDQQKAKLPADVWDNMEKAFDGFKQLDAIHDQAYADYRRLSGETESRQVQAQLAAKDWHSLPTELPGFESAGNQLVSFDNPVSFSPPVPPVKKRSDPLDPGVNTGAVKKKEIGPETTRQPPLSYEFTPTPADHYPSQQVPDFTNKYNTYLNPEQETGFQTWLQDHTSSSGRDMSKDLDSYDLRGAYLNNVEQANNGHYPDTYKKPNHPGFSDQSIYHGVDGFEGGKWTQDPDDSDQWSYEPSASTLQMHGESGVRGYLQRGQGKDPPTQLILPKTPMSYEFSPVDHDPFIDYQPVEYDPFNQFVPVERDPFANRNKIVPPLILPVVQPSALGGGSWLDLAASAQGNQAPMAEPASLSQIAPPVNTVQPNYGGP